MDARIPPGRLLPVHPRPTERVLYASSNQSRLDLHRTKRRHPARRRSRSPSSRPLPTTETREKEGARTRELDAEETRPHRQNASSRRQRISPKRQRLNSLPFSTTLFPAQRATPGQALTSPNSLPAKRVPNVQLRRAHVRSLGLRSARIHGPQRHTIPTLAAARPLAWHVAVVLPALRHRPATPVKPLLCP